MNAGRYDRANSQSVAAGATVTLTDSDFIVPGNLSFRLTAFANYVGQTAALGNITWRLLINGIARAPLAAVLDILGDQAQPWPVEDDRLVASGGDKVEVQVTNAGGVAYDVGARVVGVWER
jgi:hypothetical protein